MKYITQMALFNEVVSPLLLFVMQGRTASLAFGMGIDRAASLNVVLVLEAEFQFRQVLAQWGTFLHCTALHSV